MKKICKNDKVYAVYSSVHDNATSPNQFQFLIAEERSDWITEDKEAIQVSRMCYNKGKIFRKHKHILRPRLNNYTQEAFIVVQGKLEATICDENGEFIEKVLLHQGDVLACLKGSHSFQVVEDSSIFFEVKNGCFTSVDEDKVFL